MALADLTQRLVGSRQLAGPEHERERPDVDCRDRDVGFVAVREPLGDVVLDEGARRFDRRACLARIDCRPRAGEPRASRVEVSFAQRQRDPARTCGDSDGLGRRPLGRVDGERRSRLERPDVADVERRLALFEGGGDGAMPERAPDGIRVGDAVREAARRCAVGATSLQEETGRAELALDDGAQGSDVIGREQQASPREDRRMAAVDDQAREGTAVAALDCHDVEKGVVDGRCSADEQPVAEPLAPRARDGRWAARRDQRRRAQIRHGSHCGRQCGALDQCTRGCAQRRRAPRSRSSRRPSSPTSGCGRR